MRAVFGFLLFHIGLVVVGAALLWALRLLDGARSRWGLAAAIGPAALVGACAIVPLQLDLLIIGVPLTPITSLAVALGCLSLAGLIARRRDGGPREWRTAGLTAVSRRDARVRQALTGVGLVAIAYAVAGAWVTSRLPTVYDDARIWSLRGLTLTDYHRLQAAIFLNPGQSGGHPVYPLFQPGLQALLFQLMGGPQLRFFHTELWLLFGSVLWTAGYLIHHRVPTRMRWPSWLVPLGLLAVTPVIITNLSMGYADVTGSALVAIGALALGLWLESGASRFLVLAVLFLGAGANTKDEALLAVALIMLAVAIVALTEFTPATRKAWLRARALPLTGGAGYLLLVILPWRLWTSAHHLTDGVEPKLPRAVEPGFLSSRSHELSLTGTSMFGQVLSGFGWLAAAFLVVAGVSVFTRHHRRVAAFYLTSVLLVALSLLWLYTATPLPLAPLLEETANRTDLLFMILAGVATAHLTARLMPATQSELVAPTSQQPPAPVPAATPVDELPVTISAVGCRGQEKR